MVAVGHQLPPGAGLSELGMMGDLTPFPPLARQRSYVFHGHLGSDSSLLLFKEIAGLWLAMIQTYCLTALEIVSPNWVSRLNKASFLDGVLGENQLSYFLKFIETASFPD